MPTSANSPFSSVARSVAAPARNYFNSHFEMTKDEIRRAVARGAAESSHHSMDELANVVAETQLFQSKIIGELRHETISLGERIGDLQRSVEQLEAVVAQLTTVIVALTAPADLRDVDHDVEQHANQVAATVAGLERR
jgi:hypothetical protein